MNPSPHPPPTYPPPNQNGYQPAATAAAALSQQHTPTQNGNARKRKASNQPGSRGVANLTPDQLAKKRANDREAQRAIRERTRNTIETLANRIKELESQQPFQELQKVAQERDKALQECEDLRKKLATVASVVGGNAQQQQGQAQQQPNLHELAALTAQQSPLPPLHTTLSQQPQSYPAPTSAGIPYEQQQHIHPDLRSPQTGTHSSPASQTASTASIYQADGTPLRRWSPGYEHASNAQYPQPNTSTAYEQRLPPPSQVQSQSQSNGERLGLAYVLGPKEHSTSNSPTAQRSRQTYISPPPAPQSPPLYARLPNNNAPSCPLDALLLDFLAGRRQKHASGMPLRDVAGPEYPYLAPFEDPAAVYSKAANPVSAFLIDILSKFPDIKERPEQVAVLYIMFVVLRWEICPCERCYEMMPEWVRPIREQVEVPHPAWYDHVPWPIVRQRLIETSRVKFEDFFIPFTSKECLNWPYPKDQVLIRSPSASDPEGMELKMNPVFESHLRDLSNWSLGSIFADTFPDLVDGSVRIQDGRPNVPR